METGRMDMGAIRRLEPWSKQEGPVTWTGGRAAVERNGPLCRTTLSGLTFFLSGSSFSLNLQASRPLSISADAS